MASFIDNIKRPFRRGNTLVQLMLINAGVYLVFAILTFIFPAKGAFFKAFLSDNFELVAPIKQFILKPWTIVVYFFTHNDFFHLLFNMLALFWFGNLVFEFIGSRKLLNIYILGGILSGLFYIAIYNLLAIFPQINNISSKVIGASTSVFAVMFAAVALLPEYEFYFLRTFYIKIKYVALFFLVILSYKPGSGISTGISHLGGAIAGYSYIVLLRKGIDLGSPLEGLSDWWSSLWRPKPPVKISQRKYSESTVASKSGNGGSNLDPSYFPDQDEVDAILDKIGKSGYESLTKEEKQKLYRASQKKD